LSFGFLEILIVLILLEWVIDMIIFFSGPYAVVMAPTRELAQQIEEETVKFAHFLVSSCEFVLYFF
jgi:hypothetical protein